MQHTLLNSISYKKVVWKNILTFHSNFTIVRDKFIHLDLLKHRSIKIHIADGIHWYSDCLHCVKDCSTYRVDLANGDDGKVISQVLRATPIVLAVMLANATEIILQFLCETRMRLDNCWARFARLKARTFQEKNGGKYDNAKTMSASDWVNFMCLRLSQI